jgi:signal transduction histidine kinase/CheY-like chemotaxis protein
LALIHADFRDDMARYFAERVIGRCERFDREYKIVRRNDGNERWVHGLGELELGGDGQVLRMIGTIHDITGRMEAEEEKRKLEAQLAQAQKMESIGRLAGGVAHDFNNLLTVINGYSGLMLSKLGADDPLQANIAEIHHAGERAAGLTRQLLAFSRKQVLQPRSLNLNHVVKGMVPMLERLMGEDVKIHLALGADSGMVHADPHQLEQVMMNLAVNSRDAMPGCGTLSIETATKVCGEGQTPSHPGLRAGRYAMLAVSDTGVGIDEETRQHIFEPFFTTKEVGKGTGLGLSIIHGIVVQSDGFIEVESEPGRGAAFRIYLPSVEVEAESAEPEPIAMAANGQKETVLVVEDQEQVRRYALAVLRAQGYKALEAGNADEALAIFEREPVHLLLTDVVMPNLSGRELAARLASRWPVIKVLFMSGYTDDTIVFPSELGEEAHFIQKPFSPEALAGKVRAVLGPLRAAKSAGTLQG